MADFKIDTTDGFKKAHADSDIEAKIARHCEKHGIDPLTAVKNFAVLARRQALKRFLAHVELFKMTLDVPGDIAEFGVFRGLGLFTWANLLEAYCIGDRTKVVIGFDNWQGFTGFSEQDLRAGRRCRQDHWRLQPGSLSRGSSRRDQDLR